MKTLLRKVLWMCLFAHLFMLYASLLQSRDGSQFIYYVDAPLWLTLQGMFALLLCHEGHRWLSRNTRLTTQQRAITNLLAGSILFTLTMTMLSLSITYSSQPDTITQYWLVSTAVMYLLLFIFVGSFGQLLLSLNAQRQQQQKLLHAEHSIAQQRLQLLQQQLDPHFLFNNLNVLSVLMHKSPDDAEDFLDHFTSIYRYLLQQQDKSLVPLLQELEFARSYIYLLQQRFGNHYQINITVTDDDAHSWLTIPTSLQLLLENAVKHNQATVEQPLDITISRQQGRLEITNNKQPKAFAVISTGTGLENLNQRCLLIMKQGLLQQITPEQFSVSLPLALNSGIKE